MLDVESPAHVVVFAELSPRARVRYTRFLLENDVKFSQRSTDGRFVANIRLEAGSTLSTHGDTSNQQPEEADAFGDEKSEEVMDALDSRLAAVPEALRVYANFIHLIGERHAEPGGKRGSYVKETRLVRMINDIYDARYEDLSVSTSSSPGSFPKFIRHYLTNRFGLKQLVDQQAWDLLDGLVSLQHRVDVELFSCFLQEKYPDQTLSFFLFARSSLQRLLNAAVYRPMSVKTASTPEKRQRKPVTRADGLLVWLSKAQVETLAQTVFGSKTDDTYLEFLHAMKVFVSYDANLAATRTAARVVDANEFLFVATETFHKSSRAFPSAAEATSRLDDRHDEVEAEVRPLAACAQSVLPLAFSGFQAASCRVSAPGTPAETASSTGAVVLEGGDEDQLQTRLDSLLQRVKKRKQDKTDT